MDKQWIPQLPMCCNMLLLATVSYYGYVCPLLTYTHSLLHSSTQRSGKLCVSLYLSLCVFLFCCSLVQVRLKKLTLGKVMTFETTYRAAIVPFSKMLYYDSSYLGASSFVWDVCFLYFLHFSTFWLVYQWFGKNVMLLWMCPPWLAEPQNQGSSMPA